MKAGKKCDCFIIGFSEDLFQKLKIRFASAISEEEIKRIIFDLDGFEKYTLGKIFTQ